MTTDLTEIMRRRRGNGTVLVQAPRPRNVSSPDMIQIVQRNENSYIRAAPRTIAEPTAAQIAARLAFGRAAQTTRGISDSQQRAHIVAEQVRGLRFSKRVDAVPKWARRLIAQG